MAERAIVDPEKQTGQAKESLPAQPENKPAEHFAFDDFFDQLKRGVYKPKSRQAAAAFREIQRLELQADTDSSTNAVAESLTRPACPACGNRNPRENRFCAGCGVPLDAASGQASSGEAREQTFRPASGNAAPAAGEHHYHHHYHHHYFAASEAAAPIAAGEPRAAGNIPVVRDAIRARTPAPGAPLNRAETAVRKLSRDWTQACNTHQLDDLIELYAPDAFVMRPNVPPVRGIAALREFFFSLLEAGLGEVEMEPLRVDLFGDTAYEAGRCQMLVPSALGTRREERGKYLIMAVRHEGEWKIMADCWSSDLSLATSSDATAMKPAVAAPANPGLRPVRKNI